MPDNVPSKTAIPPLLKSIGISLALAVSTWVGLAVSVTGSLTLQKQWLLPFGTAVGGILGAWISWTYFLWVRDSKREVIKDAISKGRLTCDCTKEGEIMLSQHCDTNMELDVYTCHACGRLEVVSPRGEVLISEDTKFSPPLPATARKKWLQDSNAKRRK
jgi:hypothetical protein